MVVTEALLLVLAGLVLGVPMALSVGRLAGSQLFGLSPFDGVTLAGTAIVLLLAALLAVADPARRVAGIEPAVALRAE
jgi:ABC-type antimicrobial peptide transport system permease subunit